MVGNDVVDLLDPDADPLRPRARFDARVARPAEVRAIAAAHDPSRERWAHWAAKEAAYKLLRRGDASVIFSPVRFEVEFIPSASASADAPAAASACAPAEIVPAGPVRRGRVAYGAQCVDVAVHFDSDAVHAIARLRPTFSDAAAGADDSAETVLRGLRRLDPGEPADAAALGAAARGLALDALAPALGVARLRLSVVKDGRLPGLALDDRPWAGAQAPVLSLSHHGRVVAFACGWPAAGAARRLAS